MTAYEIPLAPQAQSFSVSLANVTYQLLVKWCGPASSYTLDISDQGGAPIVTGLPLVTGRNLLEPFGNLGLGGALYVQSDGDTWAVPQYADLGVTGRLYWVV
jgi:hypothetical protein